MQVSRLVYKMKEEYKGVSESNARKQLWEKIAALPQPQLARATDALAMILGGVERPLESPPTEPKFTSSVFSGTPPVFPYRNRMKLALLKSIPTGTFIDIQFYACNAIGDGLPLDPRPLFTSSIVIEEWGPAITTRKLEGTSQLPVQLGRRVILYRNPTFYVHDTDYAVYLSHFTNDTTNQAVGDLCVLMLARISPGCGDAELATFLEMRKGCIPGCSRCRRAWARSWRPLSSDHLVCPEYSLLL